MKREDLGVIFSEGWTYEQEVEHRAQLANGTAPKRYAESLSPKRRTRTLVSVKGAQKGAQID